MQAQTIDTIKKYQELDMQLYALENEYKNSVEKKRVSFLKSKYKDTERNYTKLIKEKDDQIANFEKTIKKFEDLKVIEENIDQDITEIKDLAELDLYEDGLIKYEEYITTIDKEMNRTVKKLNEIKIEAEMLIKTIEDIRIKYKKVKAARDLKKKEMIQKAAPLVQQMDKLKKEIDEDFMKKYQHLRENKIMPAFVQYVDGNCAGCGMEINLEVEKKLKKSGDYTECPECRRIVYKA
ncbi:MAG: zinc ribbon domain-containing protein [Bacillota bacterium]